MMRFLLILVLKPRMRKKKSLVKSISQKIKLVCIQMIKKELKYFSKKISDNDLSSFEVEF